MLLAGPRVGRVPSLRLLHLLVLRRFLSVPRLISPCAPFASLYGP